MARPIRAEAPSGQPWRVRLSPDERDRAREAARVNQQTVSAFVRDAIDSAAAECLERPGRPGRRDDR